MKLEYVRLGSDGMQTDAGRLRGTLEAPGYDMSLVSNIRCVRVTAQGWKRPVYIPIERLDNFSPDTEALVSKK